MKKDHAPQSANAENKMRPVADKKTNGKTGNKKNGDDLGTMKLGKAHSIDDDMPTISKVKESKK
jgi:hypothetical protein